MDGLIAVFCLLLSFLPIGCNGYETILSRKAVVGQYRELIRKREVLAVACPRDTYPFTVGGKVKQCRPGDRKLSCPEGFICYYDSIDERYICCGRIPVGVCDGGRPYLDQQTHEPQRCNINANNVCRPPYSCLPKSGASNGDGFCCLALVNVEPPPVGCPWGTRPLRDANKNMIPCTPGIANGCPGNSICYFDSLDRSSRCCGRDPGEGCPSGTRAVKNKNGQVTPCLPGDPSNSCPDKSVCQWSHMIDRFQCCQSDDGCPPDSSPLIDPKTKIIQTCRPDQETSCPPAHTCQFNFWTTAYQCCGKQTVVFGLDDQDVQTTTTDAVDANSVVDQGQVCQRGKCDDEQTQALISDGRLSSEQWNEIEYFCQSFSFYWACSSLCPAGLVAYVDPATNTARSCLVNQPSVGCPAGYSCQISTTGQGLCCGTSGQCPPGSTKWLDSTGRPLSCTPSVQSSCVRPATCQPAIGGPQGQFLCCSPTSSGVAECPVGHAMPNNQLITCSPSQPTCEPGVACVSSISNPSTFICCQNTNIPPVTPGPPPSPAGQCPVGYRLQNDQQMTCNPAAPMCPMGAQCLPSPAQQNVFFCCTPSTESPQCPPNYSLQDNVVTVCNPSASVCQPTSSCLPSMTNPSLFLCCSMGDVGPQPTAQCPAGFKPQNNVATMCNPMAPASCQPGASCLPSTGNPSFSLCCTLASTSTTTTPGGGAFECPAGFVSENNQVTPCDPGTLAPCQTNGFCLPSVVSPSNYLCCVGTSPTSVQCPSGYSPQSNQPTQCLVQNPGTRCSSNAACLAAQGGPSLHICCAPAQSTIQCPLGFAQQNDVVTQCSPSFATCLSSSQCLPSMSNPNLFLCCTPRSGGIAPACPLGYSTPASAPQSCTAGMPGTCPPNSHCLAAANLPSTFLCCQSGGFSGQFQCPGNGQPAMTGGSYTFCDINTGCSAGYACQPASNAAGVSVCCTASGLAPTCPNGASPSPLTNAGTGHYAFCTLTNANCPPASTCQTATNMANTYVCCGASGQLNCADGHTPLMDPSGQATLCSPGSSLACPAPSVCQPAVNNPQRFLCCHLASEGSICPAPGSSPLLVNGLPQNCGGPSAPCPQGYSCQQMASEQFVCCSTSVSTSVQCATGQQIYQPGSVTFFCNPLLKQCPAQYDCMPSTLSGQNVCCLRSATSWQCVSGRQPFPNSSSPQTCSPVSTVCPTGTACELSSVPNQYICCALSSSKAQCPANATPFLEGITPRRCSGPSDLSCPAPYSCAPSDQPNTYICCQFASPGGSLRCFSGAAAFVPAGSGQPLTCTASTQNCPSGFSCQASTAPGVTICCGSASSGSQLFCPDGTLPVSDNGHPLVCSNAGVVCPATHVCLQSSQPGVRVCCAVSAAVAVAVATTATTSSTASVCGPGQQAYMVNNQPQTCQIGVPTCAESFICQQGSTGGYYCCEGPRCPSGVTVLETNGNPRYCNPAANSCTFGSVCQQSVNLPGNYVCCMSSISQSPSFARCIGRRTYMPTGVPETCTTPSSCPPGNECSSFTTTKDSICCASTVEMGAPPACPEGDPYRDAVTKQYHYCSDTNYACPEGFVCKRTLNIVSSPGQYVCCSSRSACQKGWQPYVDRYTGAALQCSPFDKNACKPPGPPYKCQQSTKPGEHLCCTEMLNNDDARRRVVQQQLPAVSAVKSRL